MTNGHNTSKIRKRVAISSSHTGNMCCSLNDWFVVRSKNKLSQWTREKMNREMVESRKESNFKLGASTTLTTWTIINIIADIIPPRSTRNFNYLLALSWDKQNWQYRLGWIALRSIFFYKNHQNSMINKHEVCFSTRILFRLDNLISLNMLFRKKLADSSKVLDDFSSNQRDYTTLKLKIWIKYVNSAYIA